MTSSQITTNLDNLLLKPIDNETFIYDLLLAYGIPNASIARLQKHGLNLAKNSGEIDWKAKLFFKPMAQENLEKIHSLGFQNSLNIPELGLEKALKHSPRFVVLTDFLTIFSYDSKTKESLKIPVLDLSKHYDFFLPWAGMEKATHQNENPADVKAAEKMAKLYDEIRKDNVSQSLDDVHNLNVFLSRLLFCFFAEDTDIFQKNQFTHAISNHTQTDGSDLNTELDALFKIMNMPRNQAGSNVALESLPKYLTDFPYVNGGLFRNTHFAPVFTKRSRAILIECGELDWSKINPDIFGSMIQAVITPEHRGGMGMHYTSVPNIMKVIEPLFLNELQEEFDSINGNLLNLTGLKDLSGLTGLTTGNPTRNLTGLKDLSGLKTKGNIKKLNELLKRLWNIKIFDPACGSGNFLIIAYKKMRELEMAIFKEIDRINQTFSNQFTGISLDNFYGIELDDFAHEIAILSLWLAEHQMNQAFFEQFGRTKPALPLKETGNIVHGNATRLDWKMVCPANESDEIYILGNPPYLGSFLQSKEQKEDLALVCKGFKSYKDLDYIACWFIKGAMFIKNHSIKMAFVTTNSICQGEQVTLLWPFILSKNLEIFFAFQSFKWINNAKANAGVYCTIIGIGETTNKKKRIFNGSISHIVDNISPYLSSGSNLIISKRMKPISNIPHMNYGSKIVDNGHLIFSTEEKNELLKEFPDAIYLFKKLAGSAEFIRGLDRWCLYVDEDDLDFANSIPPIAKRFELVSAFRERSTEASTREMSNSPYRFYYSVHNNSDSIIIPRTSSERRDYIPMGFLNGDTIVSDAASVVFNAQLWNFSILTSRIHMTWIRAIAGRLKTDYRYSSQLCYNTFPFPPLSETQKAELQKHVLNILDEREVYSERTLAQLYDPDKMPDALREAHHQNDLAIERCYRSKPFESDEERLEYLFKLYEQMIEQEKTAGTLFAGEGKTKKKK